MGCEDQLMAGADSIEALDAALTEAFDPSGFGFPWYRSIEDEEVRAVRSNQAIGLLDAASANIDALRIRCR